MYKITRLWGLHKWTRTKFYAQKLYHWSRCGNNNKSVLLQACDMPLKKNKVIPKPLKWFGGKKKKNYMTSWRHYLPVSSGITKVRETAVMLLADALIQASVMIRRSIRFSFTGHVGCTRKTSYPLSFLVTEHMFHHQQTFLCVNLPK